jgi:acyl-coenzyme A thioesterase PaaI-like protein
MPESTRTRLFRLFFNLFPAYRRTGGRVTHIAADWSEVRVKLPLNWTTRNYVGTLFGGSIYGAVDPVYMLMLLKRLGDDYIVWDKAASIRFRRPGRGTLRATFTMPDDEINAIRAALETERSVDRVYTVDFVADDGTVCATVEKTLYVRRKDGR